MHHTQFECKGTKKNCNCKNKTLKLLHMCENMSTFARFFEKNKNIY